MGRSDKMISLLKKWSVRAIGVLSLLIMVFLTSISMVYTECMVEIEKPVRQSDSVPGNLIFLAVMLALFSVIRFFLLKKEEVLSKAVNIVTILGVVYALIISLIWASLSCVPPHGDGWYLCIMADMIENGLYDVMSPVGYLSSCPHQYGLLCVLQIINHFSGGMNYEIFQIFNALLMPLLVFAGYRIVWYTFQKKEICIYYWLLIIGYLPIWLYVPYVYGEISSITFSMILIWQTLRFCREGKYNVFCIAGAAGIACQMRLNSLILVIACCLVLLLYGCCHSQIKALLMIACIVGGVLAASAGVKGYYEHLANVKIGKGIPSEAYILMGLQDTEEAGPGWWMNLNYNLYVEHNYDTEATAAYCRKEIGSRLQELMQGGGVDFFYRKVESQWNEPDSHVYFETERGVQEAEEISWLSERVYTGTGRALIGHWMDRYQFMLYACAMFLAAAMLKGNSGRDIPSYLLFVTIIGGFLFSILWEAKSRYVLPYMVVIVMLSSGGIWAAQEAALKIYNRMHNP